MRQGRCIFRGTYNQHTSMKTISTLHHASLALAAAVALAAPAFAQQTTVTTTGGGTSAVVSTTTTRVGRLGTITPDLMVMETASGTEPLRYSRTTRTVFVDETGAVVPAEAVSAGVPVTIHYSKDADRFVAERVVVQRQAVVPPSTTTVVQPAPTVVQPAPTVVTPVPIVEEKTIVKQPAPVVKKQSTTTTTTTTPAKVRKKADDEDDD